MIKVFLGIALVGSLALAGPKKAVPCPQIDKTKLDVDGMPFCPTEVKTRTAYSVFRCAMDQASSFHTPTAKEKTDMESLLSSFAKSTVDGVKAETTKPLLAAADSLGLQACRVAQERDGAKDSYLLVYTKPGVKNYSGPFMMLRETKASKLVLIGPHDDSDGTFKVTKVAIDKTSTLALFSNGHRRGKVGVEGRRSDFVHSENNLGTDAVRIFGKLFPKHVWLHVHGMKDPRHCLYRSHSKVYGKAFEKAITSATNIKPDAFKPLNAYFTVDNETNSAGWYLKTEIPARIYGNGDMSVTRIVKELEKNDFVWSAPTQPDDDKEPDPTKPGDNGVEDPNDGGGIVPPEDDSEDEVKEELEDQKDPGEDDAGPETTAPDVTTLPPETAATPKRPPQRILKGKRDLLCIGVAYSTGELGAGKPGCDNLAAILKNFWERNSRGVLQLNSKGADPFQSGLPGGSGPGGWKQARRSYNQSVNMIKKAFPGLDYYVIPGKYTHPHAGGKVAHVKSVQAMTAQHETGHLLGLGHAGAYVYKNGKPELNAYGDTDSIMGRIISKYISAPQYYYLGWLKPEEIADYDKATPHYDLGKIGDWKGLQTVIVPPSSYGDGKGRWVFVSSTRCGGNKKPGCIAIHFGTGGGSQKILEVENEAWDTHFTGLHVKKLQNLNGKIRVKIDFDPKPVASPKK